MSQPRYSVVSTVNDEEVFARNLAASPLVASGRAEIHVERNAERMSAAYNRGLDATRGALVIFAHQDVYLPEGWADALEREIARLEADDPDWAVLGVIGVVRDSGKAQGLLGAVRPVMTGSVWCAANRGVIGARCPAPTPAQSLDELVLVLRRASGLRFDPELPHFHLYGLDLAQTAWAQGRSVYIVDAPVIHNSKVVLSLWRGFFDSYRYVQRKWRRKLPLATPITTVTHMGLPLLERQFYLWRSRARRAAAGVSPDRQPLDIANEIGFTPAFYHEER